MYRFVLALAIVAFLAPPSPAAAGTNEATGSGRMMLVMDASGSMAEPASGGETKIDAAKRALGTVIDSLPADQAVGMRVYGATVFSAADAGACTDSQKVVDPATKNRDELRAAIADYEPYGETPIGHALQEAGKDLGGDGQRTIVLVSDGEPTCDPDPCQVAAELSAQGIDLRIDVVGLDVDGTARDKLRCIADAGHGTYYDAAGAADLVDSLTIAQTRASRPFDLTGEPVEGTPSPSGAPSIQAPGQYLDALPVDGPLVYRIPRTTSGSTIHVGVTFLGQAGSAGDQVRMALVPASKPGGTACGDGNAYGTAIGASDPYFSGGITSWASEGASLCNTDEELLLRLESSKSANAGHPVEIAVYEEPPLADGSARDLPPATAEADWSTLEPARTIVADVIPGSSLANAPVINDGTYSLDITQGETQVLAVPLDWGQDLQAQIDAQITGATVDAAVVGSDLTVDIVGPLRTEDGVSFYAHEPGDWTTAPFPSLHAGDAFRTGAQSAEVAYLNRGAGSRSQQVASIAGLRYVRVKFQAPRGDGNQPYTLTVNTNGEPGGGEPDYRDVDALVPPEADSALASAVTIGPDGSTTDSTNASSGDDDDALPWLPIGLGAAGLLALVGAAVLLAGGARSA